MTQKLLFSIGVLLSLISVNHAKGQNRDPWSRISAYDKNKDGKVTREEFGGPAHILARFDTNKDGSLTREEVAAAKPGRGGRGPDNAPKVGSEAPQVSAIHATSGEVIDLSDPGKVSVLIFGSHT